MVLKTGGEQASFVLHNLVLFLDSLQEKSYYIFNKLQRVLVWNKKSRIALDAYAVFLLPRPGLLHLISVKTEGGEMQ